MKAALEIVNMCVENYGGDEAREAWRTVLTESTPSASTNTQRDEIISKLRKWCDLLLGNIDQLNKMNRVTIIEHCQAMVLGK
jgi:hypothetical protein